MYFYRSGVSAVLFNITLEFDRDPSTEFTNTKENVLQKFIGFIRVTVHEHVKVVGFKKQ